MSKLDRLALAFNSDLAALRGDQIGKLLSVVRNGVSLEAAQAEVEKLHGFFWRLECDREERFRKQYETTTAL